MEPRFVDKYRVIITLPIPAFPPQRKAIRKPPDVSVNVVSASKKTFHSNYLITALIISVKK